jgi:hypothetical protein
MLKVTQNAKEALYKKLNEAPKNSGVRIRIHPDPQKGIKLVYDIKRHGDVIIQHDGKDLLLINREVSTLLGTMELDAQVTSKGLQLKLK